MNLLNLKSKFTVAIFITVSLMFAACEKNHDATVPTFNNEPFTFIKSGNQWIYRVYDRTSKKLLDTTKWIIFADDDSKYTINVYLGSNYDNDYITYQDYKKDVWILGFHNMYKDGELFIGTIELPQSGYWSKGQNFDIYDGPILIKATATIVSVSEKVTVPAGTFTDCIKVKVQYPDKREDYYWVHKKFGNIIAEENDKIYKLISKNF